MADDTYYSRSKAFDEDENVGSSPRTGATMGDVIAERWSRRDVLKGALAVAAIGAAGAPASWLGVGAAKAQAANTTPSFQFTELEAGSDERLYVAQGHEAQVLIRWGDAVLEGAPDYDPLKQSAAAQARQFGYNNDFLGYIPLAGASDHGLLVVNHEYTSDALMFPGATAPEGVPSRARTSKARADIEMMAHGGSVIEVRKAAGGWSVVAGSAFARRITAETEMRLGGPAAGHPLLRTKDDPSGTRVRGMLSNCAGGVTPWGTWLTCEENFNANFWGKAEGQANEKALKRYGVPANAYDWGVYYDRFDVAKEPNECNRFGWVVEIDPMDPASMPVKRTALGRFKHEGAGNIVNGDGRFVVYSGDDERFDYVYKFVTEGKVDAADRAANRDLLDRGTLYVARYNPDGTGTWLALIHGEGPLTAVNGFADQGEVLIHARLAADLLGATRMDRPEDIEANPRTGKVYVMLTNNKQRMASETDAANPRAGNRFGHIIEMMPEGGDHAATSFRWEILVRCGNPSNLAVGASFNAATSKNGWFGMPDNCVFDADGRLWIATDGNSLKDTGRADGVWAMETEGAARGTSKLFFRCPNGAELCGPAFTPDLTTLFVAVQHPGESEDETTPGTFENPGTRWPDFEPGRPPRPSVVAITRKGGGKIAV